MRTGVANYWPQDRFCTDDDCPEIYDGEHPVTYLNSMWLHFVTAATIGYGEYTVGDSFGSTSFTPVRRKCAHSMFFPIRSLRLESPICAMDWLKQLSPSRLCAAQVHTQFGRFLVCISFIVGLMISSFVVTVVFDALSITSSEQYIIDKLKMKRMSIDLIENATIVVQRLARAWLLRRELGMLAFEPIEHHRFFTTSHVSPNTEIFAGRVWGHAGGKQRKRNSCARVLSMRNSPDACV